MLLNPFHQRFELSSLLSQQQRCKAFVFQFPFQFFLVFLDSQLQIAIFLCSILWKSQQILLCFWGSQFSCCKVNKWTSFIPSKWTYCFTNKTMTLNTGILFFTIMLYYCKISSFLFRFKVSNKEKIIVVLKKVRLIPSLSCRNGVSSQRYPQSLTGYIRVNRLLEH